MNLPDISPDDLPPRKAYLRSQQQTHHRRLLGVFPAVYPREILWSLNILPVEIWDPPLQRSRSAAHLPPNICEVACSGLELILQGHCDELDGFLFPHTCDSIQNLASIVAHILGTGRPCLFFYPPRAADSQAARAYCRRQLKRLTGELEHLFDDRCTESKLAESVGMGQRIDALICDIYALRGRGRLNVPNAEFYATLRSGEYLHPNDFTFVLKQLRQKAGAADLRKKNTGRGKRHTAGAAGFFTPAR